MVVKGVKSIKRTYSKHSIANELRNVDLNDRRLEKRLQITAELLEQSPNSSIPEACKSKAQTKATYRLLDNCKLSPDSILTSHRIETIKRIKSHKIILVAQDTSSLNFSTHKKTKGLGPLGATDALQGLLMHSAFSLTVTGVPLGLLAQKTWARNPMNMVKVQYGKSFPLRPKKVTNGLR
jgi:hypothetical protein